MACLVQKGPNQGTHEPPKAWAALSKWLPSHNTEIDYWWKVTGTPLAMMMDAAGYSLEGQYDALLSHYHWTVRISVDFSVMMLIQPIQIPYLGCAPRPDVNRQWSSIFGAQPLDYCWKWNTATTQPDVRCTMEAFNRFSGTKMDPLAQDASRELLCCLQAAMPSIDVSYVTPMSTWDEGLSRISPGDESRIAVSEFIETNPEGKLLSPLYVTFRFRSFPATNEESRQHAGHRPRETGSVTAEVLLSDSEHDFLVGTRDHDPRRTRCHLRGPVSGATESDC